ncbi:MAG: PatA/PatG family cyanobactin maturation protease [Microcoleaceae cyanobacterium]
MKYYPFTLSLKPNIQVISNDDNYTLKPTEKNDLPANNILTFATFPGIDNALECLQQGNTTDALLQTITEKEGIDASVAFSRTLQQIGDRGWLQYAVLPLAIAVPMVESAGVHLNPPHWTQANVSLSRFAYQRSHEEGMVLESPLSKFRVKLLDWRASAILAQLAQPQSLRQVTPPPQIGPETAYQFLNLLWATGFLDLEAEAPGLKLWEFHNLLFHSRCRQGRHNYPTGNIASSLDVWDDFPVVKPAMSGQIVPLPQLSIDTIRQRDKTLTTAIEKRSSIREYDENHPITIEQLGELLYRSARVQEIYTLDAEQTEMMKAQFGEDFDWGELSRRPYPCGGAMYELEIYPVVRRCAGVNPGLYHYDPLNHQLAQIDAADADIQALLKDAHQSSGEQGMPQVLLIITARFGRLFRKYRSLAYALVLKHVGVLYQNLYLVATNMNLAPCSLGVGDSDRFASATGLNYIEESSVGEFILGSLPSHESVEAANSETVTVAETELQQTQPISANSETVTVAEAKLQQTQPISTNSETVTVAEVEQQQTQPISSQLSAQTTEPAAMTSTPLVSTSETKPVATHPHDLDDRIPGLIDLRNQTLGDSRITIVILDGNADHSLSCFQNANISKVFPYWHDTAEPISVEDYATYQEIDNSDLKSEEKQEQWKAALPEPILKRIQGDSHACHITSTIVGQENTPSPGLAPNCRVINIPLNTTGDTEEFISVLNLSRAFELAIELGANIIHCAACRPTQTGEGEELLMKALKKCQDNNILVVAPAGNNKGECWCMPAALPGTLAVGAMKEDGVTPYKFSNWGGNNQIEGIMAPGGEILGAQPATEEPKRLKGTSMAAPVMTGLCGLLMSLQLQKGKPIDGEAIRAALLNTAIPCDPNIVEEPERCLRGFVNLPGAMNLLFGQPSVTISFTGGGVTRVEGKAAAVTSPNIPANSATVSDSPSSVTVSDSANSATVSDSASSATVSDSPSSVTVSNSASSVTVSDSASSVTVSDSPNIATVSQTHNNTVTASSTGELSTPAAVTPSTAYSGHVYALGTIGYDFGSEARRDTFKQLMPAVDLNGVMVPANPYNTRQMVDYVDQNPDEGRELIWTLNVDLNPVYVLEPKGPFAPEIYEMLLIMLDGQIEAETSDEFIERVSVPARRTNRTVELMSGQVVPVITLHHVRGMYGWKVNTLVNAALRAVGAEDEASIEAIRYSLTSFLNRVYYDLRNLGQTSRDRALNFAATNTFQAASTFAEAIADNRQLDSIEVEKSPYCRINSDCWDIKLKFFDPVNGRRARKVFRFTVDVAENLPVTLGKVKSWSVTK